MVVTATYSDGSSNTVTGYTVTDGTALTAGQTSVTISYTEGGVTKTTTQAITVNAAPKTLSSIAVTTAPAKVTYTAGEYFNASGMVVTATYSDGSTEAVTGYTFTPTVALTTGDTSITISYTEGGVTKTATQAITVNASLPEFTITFDGNGGTPSASGMTTTGQKLAALPTATRSGSYSFDGWYTAASGGNKITTDYVFSADTTVYAHWRYTGSTGGGEHTHSYGTVWKSDGNNHWHECGCGLKADEAAHSFEWKTDKAATATEEGSKHEECTVCGYKKAAIAIDKLSPSITEGD